MSIPPRQHRTLWWKEASLFGLFYAVYTFTRNQFGSDYINGAEVPMRAFNNAMKMIRFESWIGLYHEESVQDAFLGYRWFIQAMNTYYGTAHFFVTIAVFIVLYKKRPDVFPQWRNTLAATTALAIIGFSLFPLMPPRLLDAPCPADGGFGGACIEATERGSDDGKENFGFVDTLEVYGGPWDFSSGAAAKVSNQYAAMPSLHIGWASWCAFAMWPLAKRKWIRATLLLYPALTLFCVVVTANHYWIDGVGGQLTLLVGFLIGTGIHKWNQNRLDTKHERRMATAQSG
jgi:membrane-associated phospholipid phosphatase